MNFNCELCNYTSDILSNFVRHKKSLKHISKSKHAASDHSDTDPMIRKDNLNDQYKNDLFLDEITGKTITEVDDENNNNDTYDAEYQCDDCDKIFKYETNMYRHKRTACSKNKKKSIIRNKINEPDRIKKLEKALFDAELKMKDIEIKHLQEIIKIKENETSQHIKTLNENLDHNKSLVNKAGNLATQNSKNTEKSLDVLKYLINNYPKPPPLESVPTEKYAELAENNHSFGKTLTYYYNEKQLHVPFGEFIKKNYKVCDPSKLSMLATDTSRNNFYIVDENGEWFLDKKGNRVDKKLLQPMFKYSKSEMLKYNNEENKLSRNMKLSLGKMEEHNKNNKAGDKIIDCMTNGELSKSVLSYIGPHFVCSISDLQNTNKENIDLLEKDNEPELDLEELEIDDGEIEEEMSGENNGEKENDDDVLINTSENPNMINEEGSFMELLNKTQNLMSKHRF
jgi:hypothetical protein